MWIIHEKIGQNNLGKRFFYNFDIYRALSVALENVFSTFVIFPKIDFLFLFIFLFRIGKRVVWARRQVQEKSDINF